MAFWTSLTTSTTSSIWALTRLQFPARPNSLARYLAMAIDWQMLTPSTSKTGNCPNGRDGFRLGMSSINMKYWSSDRIVLMTMMMMVVRMIIMISYRKKLFCPHIPWQRRRGRAWRSPPCRDHWSKWAWCWTWWSDGDWLTGEMSTASLPYLCWWVQREHQSLGHSSNSSYTELYFSALPISRTILPTQH